MVLLPTPMIWHVTGTAHFANYRPISYPYYSKNNDRAMDDYSCFPMNVEVRFYKSWGRCSIISEWTYKYILVLSYFAY